MDCIAARLGTQLPEIISLPEPGEVRPDEVLVRTLELGICGTDRDILESSRPMTPSGTETLVLGHECLGCIERVGTRVESMNEGDLVVPAVRRPLAGSKERWPRFRTDQLPMGEYTERGIVREHGFSAPLWIDQPQHLFRVESSLADIAVFTEPLSVAEKAINEATVLQHARIEGEPWMHQPPRVLVTGMGPIAFAAVLSCRCRGYEVTVAGRDDVDTFRAEAVQDFGARYLAFNELQTLAADVEDAGFELILECTGSESVMLSVVEALKSCGVMVWLGASGNASPKPYDVAALMRHAILRNHLHIGTVNAAHRDFGDALEHLRQAKREFAKPLARLITDRVSIEDSLWHYENRRRQAIKVVVEYDS